MKRTLFTIDGFAYAYIGYTDHTRWNGWACPYFEKDEALRVMEGYNECAESPIFYNADYDTFYHFGTDSFDGEMWRGYDIHTEDGIKHLYGIGAGSWVWDDATEGDILYVAQVVEDFIYEFDTYDYKDKCTDREANVEAIKTQLKDLDVLKQVLETFYNEELTAEQKFNDLGKELKL